MKRAGSSSGPEATARRYKVEREAEIAGRERLEAQQGREKQREQSLLHEQLRSALDGLTPDEMQTFFAWRKGEEPDPATGEMDPAVELELLSKWMQTEGFETAIKQLARDESLGVRECEDFHTWLLETGLPPDDQSLNDWRCSPEFQSKKLERIAADCRCDGECSCTYDGEGLEPEIEGYNCDAYHSIDDLGELLNYGTRAGEWTPSGPVPPGVMHTSDPEMLTIPEATNFCASCSRFRPGETGLSHVEVFEGTRRRVLDRWCRMCSSCDHGEYYD